MVCSLSRIDGCRDTERSDGKDVFIRQKLVKTDSQVIILNEGDFALLPPPHDAIA